MSDSAIEEEAEEQLLRHRRLIEDPTEMIHATGYYPKAKKPESVEAREGTGLKTAASTGIKKE